MRFFLILFVLALAVIGGLYVYGGMIEPETRIIETEALGAASE